MTGGLSVFFTLSFFIVFSSLTLPHSNYYLLLSLVLVITGLLDDKLDLSPTLRLIILSLVCLSAMLLADTRIQYLGNLLGFGDVILTHGGWLFTALALIGGMTSFNMIDGLDGVLACLSMLTLSALALLCGLVGQLDLSFFCLAVLVALIPFTMVNLGLLGQNKRVFMGDSGSQYIGFTIMWIAILATQPTIGQSTTSSSIHPVNILWLVALPVMDMTRVMMGRIKHKKSPLKADRTHIHHLIQACGLSKIATLWVLIFISTLLTTLGVIAEVTNVAEYVSLGAFILTFVFFLAGTSRLDKYVRHCE